MGSAFRTASPRPIHVSITDGHEDTMDRLRTEADACQSEGDSAGACAHLDRLLRLQTRYFGAADDRTLATRLDLADHLQAQGQFKRAQAHYAHALRQYRAMGPNQERNILVIEFTRAQAYLRDGNLATARVLLLRLQQQSVRVFGSNHPATLVYTDTLAATLLRAGDLAAAKPLILELLDARANGSSAPDCAGSLATASVLVTHLIDRDTWPEAIPVQERIASLSRTLRGPGDLDTLRALSLLALILIHSQQPERARVILQSIATPLSNRLGRSHPETMNVFSSLASTFTSGDDLITARSILERCFSLAEEPMLKVRMGGELAVVLIRLRDFDALSSVLNVVTDCSQKELELITEFGAWVQ
jgi:tetratricopeptide (TPR) repeat protein